ncbi:hypothetical protein [Pseudoflavonifractor sp. MCC625]|uniref:hypothetical protein n=1 Tax=Pseudoflavonifractor sp. MCC625 TaxID=2592647 RepID=UPI001C037EFD|nr:hypothetical protein [Pseudoflavonifractor sp. MCC625]MBT9685127.1 hypothetical protein [Pseudoflavonifractor sp. MCC625]
MKYRAVSFNGIYYCIEQCDDNYSPAENERILSTHEEAETFPIPCRWDEETQSWESASVPDEVNPQPQPPIEPDPGPTDPITQIQLAMAELAETMEASTTETQLAVAELAERMAAGEVSK